MVSSTSTSETTPLLALPDGDGDGGNNHQNNNDPRYNLFEFLEARTSYGLLYEKFIIVLIMVNVVAFIIGSLFVEEYNTTVTWAGPNGGVCGYTCDKLWFGNYDNNGLDTFCFGLIPLKGGTTSYLEIYTVVIFTIEYILRLYTADLLDIKYKGFVGKLKFIPTFFSLIDLVSTVPFYIDMFVLTNNDIVASTFLRMFRLLRMMRVEGRYDTALCMAEDVYKAQKSLLGTALFVGITTWITVSSLYYLAERKSLDMIYCGQAPEYCYIRTIDDNTTDANETSTTTFVVDEIDTSLCSIDEWGITDCTNAGCPPSIEYPEPCYNLYQSIPMSSYFALLNLFGEFPLIDQHNVWGKVVGTITAVIAVAVFALPAGIVGNGFENQIEKRRTIRRQQQEQEQQQSQTAAAASTDGGDGDGEGDTTISSSDLALIERDGVTPGYTSPNTTTIRGQMYNFLHAQKLPGAIAFDTFVNVLIVITVITFMIDSLEFLPTWIRALSDIIEFIAVVVFTIEYVGRVYSVVEDPKFSSSTAHEGGGTSSSRSRFHYMTSFLPIVDLLSVLPYWIEIFITREIVNTTYDNSWTSILVKSLRLLRILKFEKYTHAFTSFDEVISDNLDVLAVTAFTAILLWILLGSILYFTERDNPDAEMAANYSTIPNAMWVTLLNLSGEAPLCQYSLWGKVCTGLCGLFATGIFGIPIGILGAGFEAIVEEETEDNTEELAANERAVTASQQSELGTSLERWCYKFVNGLESSAARTFETGIYAFIFIAVGVGVLQTVEGHEHDLEQVELVTVLVFTVEYLIRLIGVGADPEFAFNGTTPRSGLMARLNFLISFYSIIDLLAIVPYYVTVVAPGSFVNEYDEYLRMLRIIRLVKLDKYIPSITLIDDVIRLKFNALRVAFFAAITLWLIFAALMYMFETNDDDNEIDPVPDYGCDSDCTMIDRFQNFFDSMVYTGVHLTGDYPIITYNWPSRFVNFFMVIAAVGVVSIPSGLIASGFVEIVQSKAKAKRQLRDGGTLQDTPPEEGRAGDDWYEIRYRQLEGVDPPLSPWGPKVDAWQIAVNEFLNGTEDEQGHTQWTVWSRTSRVFIFTVIILNIAAVILESIPSIDRAVGNDPGNFFDVFEAFSVMVFAAEYMGRLFCAPKNREALFSTAVYATTFFGIVDFLSTAPWFIEQALIATGAVSPGDDAARIFRIFRMFRILQLEDFIVAFSKLDNVFRASKDVLKATGLMALIIWVGCAALFYIFEENNPNWRHCDDSVPLRGTHDEPGCYDFKSTAECNAHYPDMCSQVVFTNMPNSLYLTAVFLGGEWGLIDFSFAGRLVCLFLCVVGIGLYAIPVGALFDSFGAVLGLDGDDDDEDEGNV